MKTIALIACLLSTLAGAADAQTAAQVVHQTSLFGNARDITLSVTMTLKTAAGAKERGLAISLKRSADAVRVLAAMVSPAFLSQMKFLTRRDADGATSTWLKTSQGVRKLGAGSGAERIFDSQFTVEDFTDVDLNLFSASLRDDVVDGAACFAVELVPHATAGYARKVLLVRKDTYQLLGIDYHDAQGVLIRQYRVLDTGTAAGMVYPARSVMKDLVSGDETILTVTAIDTSRTIPESAFNKAAL